MSSMSTRTNERGRLLRRGYVAAASLLVLTLLFLLTGHWILAIVFGVPAGIAAWAVLQMRAVR